jgi:hypothetical protein
MRANIPSGRRLGSWNKSARVNQTLGFRFQRDGIAGLGKRMPFLLNTQYGQASRPAQYQSLPQFERPFAPKAFGARLA